MSIKRSVFISFFLILGSTSSVDAATYYVDSVSGSDSNSCAEAQSTSTPKMTIGSVNGCSPTGGDIVKMRGTFTSTITPPNSGTVLEAFQAISGVSGSTITFDHTLSGLSSDTDYVAVYNSRKGNSGAFPVVSCSESSVTVDTSDLPAVEFYTETSSDPGDLSAAIIRPLLYTAWDTNNPPTWTGNVYTTNSYNKRAVMFSYLNSETGESGQVWPAFQLDGDPDADLDYHIFDHLDVQYAEAAINTQNGTYHANYAVVQHSYFHNTGMENGASDEVIYWGNYEGVDKHFDYIQIMYNKIGPHRSSTNVLGDGIELKLNARYGTIFGNEIFQVYPNGCDDAPLKVTGAAGYISNNYIHDITSTDPQGGCGISVVGGTGQANGTIVVNNILENIQDVAIRNLKASDNVIANNTVYNVFPMSGGSEAFGILIWDYSEAIDNVIVRNNIIHTSVTGIGRYTGAGLTNYSVDHNIVYNTDTPFYFFTQSGTDSTSDPGLLDPANSNFAITDSSLANDFGSDLSAYFSLDNHDADAPTLFTITEPIVRTGTWDAGVYEYDAGSPPAEPTPTPAPSSITIVSNSSAQSCNQTAPGEPDLFQINARSTGATLYFAPPSGTHDYYFVAFGRVPGEEIYGGQFNLGFLRGVGSITVGHLSPLTTYYFKVRAGNGCAPGQWSRSLGITTTALRSKSTNIRYKGRTSLKRIFVTAITPWWLR